MNGVIAKSPTYLAPTGFVPPSLPALSIKRWGEPLGASRSPNGELRRLHTRAHFELTEVRLHGATRLTLTPAGEAGETLYLLSGGLSGDLAGDTCTLGPGDAVFTENLAEPLVLTALTDTRLLYLTEKPPVYPR